MKMKITLAAVAICVGMSAQAAVVAAWDFADKTSGASAGWTTWDLASYTNAGATSTIGDLTLEHTSFAFKNDEILSKNPGFWVESDPALLPAGNDVIKDWGNIDGQIPQVFTLTGLTEGQEYRFQFLGMTQQGSTPGLNRNMTVTLDDAGVTTANLHTDTASQITTGFYTGYSEYFTFTATVGDTDLVMTFTEAGGGKKGVSGLIVDAVPEPAALGLFAAAGAVMLTIRRRLLSK